MRNGIYPPSLKFKITYEYEMQEGHRRRRHNVCVTGCDKADEVTFDIDVFEPPDTPGMVLVSVCMRMQMCVCVCVCVVLIA